MRESESPPPWLGVADLAGNHWPAQRVIVELDGFETHGTRAAFRADRAKDAALTAAGYRVLRFTRDDDPELAIKRLRACSLAEEAAL
jgi:very-short-patch-repair endonuclease